MDTNPDHDDIISELSTFYENHRSFYRSHNKETPTLPITGTDIQLEGKWTQFFIADDGNADKIIMFTTARRLCYILPDRDIDRWPATTQVKEVHKNRQQADNTRTPILASRTYRPRLRRPRHIASPHGNSTVV